MGTCIKQKRSMWPQNRTSLNMNDTQELAITGRSAMETCTFTNSAWGMQHHPSAVRGQKEEKRKARAWRSLAGVHGAVLGEETHVIHVKPVSQQGFFQPYLGCRDDTFLFCFRHALFNKLQSSDLLPLTIA